MNREEEIEVSDSNRPLRLHHNAAVVKDLAATREFYEEKLALPLVATWCERTKDDHDFCHAFFELQDRSCLAFFQFAEPDQYEALKKPAGISDYNHIALAVDEGYQGRVERSLKASGQSVIVINHGYCRSLYVHDPDGHLVELTVDDPDAVRNAPTHRAAAHDELNRWLAGDHRENNIYRKNIPPAESLLSE
jgi:catechol 2,3-dioxygenase-like lactoylglutathione lyase family enzyme